MKTFCANTLHMTTHTSTQRLTRGGRMCCHCWRAFVGKVHPATLLKDVSPQSNHAIAHDANTRAEVG